MLQEKEIKELPMIDLVAYYNANQALKNYYANLAHINSCYQNTKEKKLFEEPIRKQGDCASVETKIMKEFEKRLIEKK